MDLQMIEKAALIVFEMCNLHPEICPHDYEWMWSISTEDGKKEKHYRCSLCGKEMVVEE